MQISLYFIVWGPFFLAGRSETRPASSSTCLAALLMCLNLSGPRWMPPYHLLTTTITFLTSRSWRRCSIRPPAASSPSSSQSWSKVLLFSPRMRYASMLWVARATLLLLFNFSITDFTSATENTDAAWPWKTLFLSSRVGPVTIFGHSILWTSASKTYFISPSPPSTSSWNSSQSVWFCKNSLACSISWF